MASPEVHIAVFPYNGKEHLRISFPYSYRLKECVKAFPGTRWKPEWGCWYLADSTSIGELIAHLKAGGFRICLDTQKNEVVKPSPLPPVHPLLEGFKRFLKARRYSESTVAVYTSFANGFLNFLKDIPLEQAQNSDAEAYLEYLVLKRRISISTHRQAISALKQLAEFLPDCQIAPEGLVRPKRSRKLPTVLSTAEVIKLLQVTANLKHRCLIGLMYSSGLRIGELLSLKLEDIDLQRKLLYIRNAKGRKDRQVVLAERMLPLIRNYLNTYQPADYFAEGAGGGPYSPTSFRTFLKRNAKRAGILKKITPHTLRHSFATHLLEKGTDIRLIQELLGHAKPETTMVYTHVSRQDLLQIKSPLDLIFQTPENKAALPESSFSSENKVNNYLPL